MTDEETDEDTKEETPEEEEAAAFKQKLVDAAGSAVHSAFARSEHNRCYREHLDWRVILMVLLVGGVLGVAVNGALTNPREPKLQKWGNPNLLDARACLGWCLEKEGLPIVATDDGCICADQTDYNKTFKMTWQHRKDTETYEDRVRTFQSDYNRCVGGEKDPY